MTNFSAFSLWSLHFTSPPCNNKRSSVFLYLAFLLWSSYLVLLYYFCPALWWNKMFKKVESTYLLLNLNNQWVTEVAFVCFIRKIPIQNFKGLFEKLGPLRSPISEKLGPFWVPKRDLLWFLKNLGTLH